MHLILVTEGHEAAVNLVPLPSWAEQKQWLSKTGPYIIACLIKWIKKWTDRFSCEVKAVDPVSVSAGLWVLRDLHTLPSNCLGGSSVTEHTARKSHAQDVCSHHKITGGWKRPLELISSTHLLKAGPPTYSRLPGAMSSWVSNISKDRDSTASLGNQCQSSVIVTLTSGSPALLPAASSQTARCIDFLPPATEGWDTLVRQVWFILSVLHLFHKERENFNCQSKQSSF